MHYGGSTLDPMPAALRDAARTVNYLEDLRARRGGLTLYQEAIRFWAVSKVRAWQHIPTKEDHHA